MCKYLSWFFEHTVSPIMIHFGTFHAYRGIVALLSEMPTAVTVMAFKSFSVVRSAVIACIVNGVDSDTIFPKSF